MIVASRFVSRFEDGSHEQFLDQFEWDGGDFLYRYRMVGPAYRVTADEQDDLIAAFDRRRQRYAWAAGAVIVIGCITLFAMYVPDTSAADSDSSWWFGFLGILVGQGLRMVCDLIAFRAPLRMLDRRTPVAPALSIAQRRRIALDRVSAGELIGWAVFAAAIILLFVFMQMKADAGGLIVLACFAGLLVWAMVLGTRKWLLARQDHAASNLI